LDPWLQACHASASVELQHCAEWLQRDYAAVKAALTLAWSTGPVEGHINRLKLIKQYPPVSGEHGTRPWATRVALRRATAARHEGSLLCI
jgi:hypothetical protein